MVYAFVEAFSLHYFSIEFNIRENFFAINLKLIVCVYSGIFKSMVLYVSIVF